MPYHLPPDYHPRLEPQYFSDTLADSTYWQADIYRAAAILARRAGVSHIVDIGCGTAGKLIPLAAEFEIVGIDYGDNIEQCHMRYPEGEWHNINLQADIVPTKLFKDSVVICADIIEHLVYPDNLIETLRHAASTAAYVLVSTPDRERLQQGTENGPPANKAHVQEWTLAELEAWFKSERLPVAWAGWTISYDKQPDKVNTCCIVLSNSSAPVDMPITFEPAPHWRKSAVASKSDMLSVWMTPTPSEAYRDQSNSINNIVCRLDRYLPDYGVQLVESPDHAQVHAGHAGQGSQAPLDVAHYHGLYDTAGGSDNFAVNAAVIRNLKSARIITAPSEWIADVIRRDMHVNPRVIGWGVDVEEWKPLEPHTPPYVIWNKARTDNVSDPALMLKLAARAHDILFLTTFGNGTPNVMTIGRQPYEIMKQHVRHASVYLSTNVETFGIGTVEAMSAGVPVLAFRQGNTDRMVEHGVTGFLAELGDMDGLYEGLQYCLKYRKRLGENARQAARQYTWQRVAEQFAAIYREVVAMKADVRPHRIDEGLYKHA